jgi:hypothetical protein
MPTLRRGGGKRGDWLAFVGGGATDGSAKPSHSVNAHLEREHISLKTNNHVVYGQCAYLSFNTTTVTRSRRDDADVATLPHLAPASLDL